MEWEFKNGIPIYQQIVSMLQMRIVNGTYPPGSKVPAVRELALEAGVNPNTMQRALTELERDGLLAAQRTSGRFVTDDEERLKQLREDLGRSYISQMLEKLRELGMSDSQVQEAVMAFLREER